MLPDETDMLVYAWVLAGWPAPVRPIMAPHVTTVQRNYCSQARHILRSS